VDLEILVVELHKNNHAAPGNGHGLGERVRRPKGGQRFRSVDLGLFCIEHFPHTTSPPCRTCSRTSPTAGKSTRPSSVKSNAYVCCVMRVFLTYAGKDGGIRIWLTLAHCAQVVVIRFGHDWDQACMRMDVSILKFFFFLFCYYLF
jgi:hypothetical protein